MSILGHPIAGLFLYFLLYSFLGWVMETCYCSIYERRLVPRGFLYGPICPIYGLGVLLMILFFTPLKTSLPLFYLVSVVVMGGWEYFVSWLLEATTHVKYWDYSHFRFHLKGRICLWVALVWGVLSYVIIFWVQPLVEGFCARIPAVVMYPLCGILLAVLVIDAALTIRRLALIAKLMVSITAVSKELQTHLAQGKAMLDEKLEARSAALRQRYNEQIALLERYSRQLRARYSNMKANSRYAVFKEGILSAAGVAKEEILKRKEAILSAHQEKKSGKES